MTVSMHQKGTSMFSVLSVSITEECEASLLQFENQPIPFQEETQSNMQ